MKNIYIIPGLGENCNLQRYQQLTKRLEEKGFNVIQINPNWYLPLKSQLFSIEKDSTICGFSFGAIFAYLLAEKYSCKKIIFASISPIRAFSLKSLIEDYMLHMNKKMSTILAKEIKSIKVNFKSIKNSYITIAGEKEELVRGEKKADVLVPDTKHFMSKKYIEAIVKILE